MSTEPIFMNGLLFVVFSLFLTISSGFAANLSAFPVIDRLDQQGWKPWVFEPSTHNFTLMSVKKDLSQAIVIKPNDQWNAHYKTNRWYDIPEGSAYFLGNEKVAIYIYDFNKQAVTEELKNKVVNILKEAVGSTFSSNKNSSFSFFSSAHAAAECPAGAVVDSNVSELSQFSKSLNKAAIPLSAEAIWNMLNRCGSKVITETLDDMKKIVTDPIAWVKDTWHGLSTLVDFVANFQTTIPKVFENLKAMSGTELFDVLCPVATKILLGVMTGKLASDAATISINLIKELKAVKAILAKAKNFTIPINLTPKLPILKIMNGRLPAATLEKQAESLAKLTNGVVTVAGKELTPMTRYSGVILDDGRMLIHGGVHNELVRVGDKVGTAFEFMVNGKGKIMIAMNQSSTYLPDFKDCQTWMKWWVDKQKGFKKSTFDDVLGTGIPFRMADFKP